MSEQEQNKKLNQHSRQIADLQQRVKALELNIEPKGWISKAFEANEKEFAEINQRLASLEIEVRNGFAQMGGKLDTILNHLTGINDLPEE